MLISAIDCDGSQIEQIENGYRNGNVFRYPFSVQFGCYPGYTLRGNEEISCQDNGEWSGEPPTCLGRLFLLNNLIILFLRQETIILELHDSVISI